jgi:hypothetical protein
MRVCILRTFITRLLLHIHQKEKIALEIAAKIPSVNEPLKLYLETVPLCTVWKNSSYSSVRSFEILYNVKGRILLIIAFFPPGCPVLFDLDQSKGQQAPTCTFEKTITSFPLTFACKQWRTLREIWDGGGGANLSCHHMSAWHRPQSVCHRLSQSPSSLFRTKEF